MNSRPEAVVLDDVLNEIVLAFERPSRDALVSIIRRYPEFERDIVEFFATWAEQLLLPESRALSAEEEATIVNRAMSHVQNVVYERDTSKSSPPSVATAAAIAHTVVSAPPVTSLVGASKKVGLEIGEFERRCGLDQSLLAKLERKVIEFASIPDRLIRKIAELLHVPASAVSAFLDSPTTEQLMNARAFLLKGRLRPPQKETFAKAVERSALSEELKKRWLDEVGSKADKEYA